MIRLTIALFLLLSCCTAQALCADITKISPVHLTQQGIAAYQRGDFNSAIRFFAERARLAPEDASVYYYLGNCYLNTKQNDQAGHMFSASVRVAPASQAGKYSLKALESLSTMPRSAAPEPPAQAPAAPDPAASAAVRDSLLSEAPLDKSFNDAVKRIQSERQTVKTRVDRVWEQLQDDLQSMTPRTTTNYAVELERVSKEAENKVENLQTRELRFENRLLAPEKIDVRAIPKMPEEKTDDTKTALGSLLDYFKPEKPFDPFSVEITPELTSKFLTIKDVFGELCTYQAEARKIARQAFFQLKSGIENKQDFLDQQIYQLKYQLIRDIVNIKSTYGSQSSNRNTNPAFHLSSSKIPRADQNNLTPMDLEVSQATERAKKRIKELEDGYSRDVDSLIVGVKERVGGLVAQSGQINSQLKRASGTIQIVPLGTNVYTRNYVNFGDRPDTSTAQSSPPTGQKGKSNPAGPVVQPLRAQTLKLPRGKSYSLPPSQESP